MADSRTRPVFSRRWKETAQRQVHLVQHDVYANVTSVVRWFCGSALQQEVAAPCIYVRGNVFFQAVICRKM